MYCTAILIITALVWIANISILINIMKPKG